MRSTGIWGGVALGAVSLGWLVSCAGAPAPERVRREAHPPANVYAGWRVFQDRCARCHGADATGTGAAPDLLPRVAAMGERRFAHLVLLRYDWSLPASAAGGEGAAREALIDDVMARREPAMAMPAWQGEPQVTAHIADVYAYLAARADGTLGPGKPGR